MSIKLTGGIALITGAGSGIGRETGLDFAEAGAAGVVFADINLSNAQEAAKESQSLSSHPEFRAVAIRVDVTDEASVANMVSETLKEFGRIDYSVNSAGISVDSKNPIAEASTSEFEKLMNFHVKGLMFCVREVSRAMSVQKPITIKTRNGIREVGRGSIVNVASCFSYVAARGMLPYVTAKHAVLGMTKTAALDNAPNGIRVNAVCPSWVNTTMVKRAVEQMPELDKMTKENPFARICESEEVSSAILFLSSPQASYVSGIGMVIDGALLVQGPRAS